MSVVFSVLCMMFIILDVRECQEANLRQACKEKEAYLQAIAYSGNYAAEDLIVYIQQEYPTSASDYCFVALDEEFVFLRDSNYTKGLTEDNLYAYFGISEHTPKVEGCKNAYSIQLGSMPWYVMLWETEVNGQELTVGICTSRDYLISEADFDVLLQHSVLYMALFSISFIVSVVFLARREKENEEMEKQLTDQLMENRKLIERLGEQLDAQSSTDYQRENGFCSREVVAQIMEKLTFVQRLKSHKLEIRMKEVTPDAVVRYSVLLERMKVGKSVCCLWEEDTFLVLLLNTDEDGCANFITHFLLEYQKMFRSDATDVQILRREW